MMKHKYKDKSVNIYYSRPSLYWPFNKDICKYISMVQIYAISNDCREILVFEYFHTLSLSSLYLFRVIVFLPFLARQELQWKASQVQRETISLWLMCIEHLMISWRRDLMKWTNQKAKKLWENGAKKILLIAVLLGMLLTFTGRFMFKLYIKISGTLYSGYLCILISIIFFAGRFRDILNKWVWILLLVEMICFNTADALLLPFSSMQL